MKDKLIVSIIFYLLACSVVNAQENISKDLKLEDPLTTNTYNYKASSSISFSPGFNYKATDNNYLHASINSQNLIPNPFPNSILGGSDNGVVGKISDQFDVSPVGQAIYSIPIKLPPGTAGMQPELSIVYNSSSKEGLLGYGFDLSGLSMINRSPQNLIVDGRVTAVDFSDSDRFMLDGQRLIRISPLTQIKDIEYRTENNNFSKIIAYGEANNPQSFSVYTKSGLVYTYGSNNSELRSATYSRSLSPNVLFWLLVRVTDTKGNYYKISYGKDDTNGKYSEYWPEKIEYTGNENANLLPYCSIVFNYTEMMPFYVRYTYIAGAAIRRSKLLKSIDIYSGKNKIKYYDLSYKLNNNTFTHLLGSVTEMASDGRKLNPTQFDWQMTSDFTMRENSFIEDKYTFGGAAIYVGDFDGDGVDNVMTLVRLDENNSIYRIFSGSQRLSQIVSGYFPNTMNAEALFVGDFNGDGVSDVVVKAKSGKNTYKWDLYLASKEYPDSRYEFTYSKTLGEHPNSTRTIEKVGDFNGDGIDDFVNFCYSDKIDKAETTIYLGNPEDPCSTKYKDPIPATKSSKSTMKIEVVDINGDGLSDLLYVNKESNELFVNQGKFEGETSIASSYFVGPLTIESEAIRKSDRDQDNYFCGDFNGDGKTDILVYAKIGGNDTTGKRFWYILFSNGKGFEDRQIVLVTHAPNMDEFQIYVGDFNGDGLSDFYAISQEKSQLFINSSSNDNGGIIFNEYKGFNSNGIKDRSFYLTDFNGDGRADMLEFLHSKTFGYKLYESQGQLNNYLSVITDGLGNKTEISYKALTDKMGTSVYRRSISENYPLSVITPSLYVVNKVSKSNGIGGEFTTSFFYENAIVHKRGRGLLGFQSFTIKDETNDIETTSEFGIDKTQYIPYLKSKRTTTGRYPITLSTSDFFYKKKYYNTPAYQPNKIYTNDLVGSIEKKYEPTTGEVYSTLESTIEYDDYGNVLTSTVKYDNSETITNTNKYTNDESLWRIGLLTESVVTKKKGSEVITRKSTYDYDPKSNLLIAESNEPNDSKFGLVKKYGHDSFGNIVSTTITPRDSKLKVRTSTSKYDSYGRFEVEATDNLGFTTKSEMDQEFGLMKSITDVNRMKTEYIYDSFGQLLITKTPLGNTQRVLRWSKGHTDAPTNAMYYSYAESSGSTPVIEFFDALGRSLRKVVVGFNGQKIYTDALYNSKGQNDKISEPYFVGQTAYWNSAEFDNLGRVVKQNSADGTSTTIQYTALTTTSTNYLGQKNIEKRDSQGRIIENIDNLNGSVMYEYDIAGNSRKVVGPRTTIQSEYDKMGNKTKLMDPDLGTTIYDYNAYGELVSQQNNQEIPTVFEYDVVGRIIKETSKEGIITYSYDKQWKGAVDKVTSSVNNISQSIKYDSYGRIIEVTETIDNKTYVTQSTYDEYGRIDKMIYPSQFAVQNQYNENGYLTRVKDVQTGKNYWEAKTMNARGQLESFRLGNNLTTIIKHDAKLGYISDIITPGIQDWSYKFNGIGNLTDRIDNTKKLTEHFDYDGLNRLWKVSQNGEFKQETLYDAAGNITSKTGIGTFTYENGTNRLVSVSGNNYNPLNWDDIQYTSFNKISHIQQGTSSLELIYGLNKDRKKAITNRNGVIDTKYYVGSIYEEQYMADGEFKKIHYISANGEMIAIKEQSTKSGEQLLYVHKDHLGSIQAYSDTSGKLYGEELSYDAWGRRRNASDWQYYAALTDAKAFNPNGFTGHEHLDLFEMINMNGRMYDPVIGRFLSPDPFVQAPDFTQGLNRYSYCMNNPLSFIDPSGYNWFSKHWKSLVSGAVGIAASFIPGGQGLGIALIGGALGGAAAGITGALLNGANFEVFMKSTLGGLLSGTAGSFGGYLIGSVVTKLNPWDGILASSLNLVISEVTPSIPIVKGNGLNISISPILLFTRGVSGSAGGADADWVQHLGVGVTVSQKIGDWTIVAGGDLTYQNGGIQNELGGVYFSGISYDDGDCGFSLLMNSYYQRDKQISAVLGFRYQDLKFSFEDDVFPGKLFPSLKGLDRFRTAAMEIQYQTFIVGVNVYTNDPDKTLPRDDSVNPLGAHHDGRQLSSPIYVGSRRGNSISRYGWNNEKGGFVGQNWWHRSIGLMATPDFKYGDYNNSFIQVGTYRPYTFY